MIITGEHQSLQTPATPREPIRSAIWSRRRWTNIRSCLVSHSNRLWTLSSFHWCPWLQHSNCKNIYWSKVYLAGTLFSLLLLLFIICGINDCCYYYDSYWSCLIVKTQEKGIIWKPLFIAFMASSYLYVGLLELLLEIYFVHLCIC